MKRIFDTMIKIENYTAKHSDATNDYKAAYDLVNTLGKGKSAAYTPNIIKVFRKYIYDLSYKHNKGFATRKSGDFGLIITRLS